MSKIYQIKNQEIFECYECSEGKIFFDIVYHDTNFNNHIFFVAQKNKKIMMTLNTPLVNERNKFLESLQINKDLDYYYSLNEFRYLKGQLNRRETNVFAYRGIVVDIDCHHGSKNTKKMRGEIAKYIIKYHKLMEEDKILPYTVMMRTGCGLQFIYIYERALHYSLKFLHNMLVEHILKIHEELLEGNGYLKLDAGVSRKAPGLYRMPNTYNSRNHNKTSYHVGWKGYINVQSVIDSINMNKKQQTHICKGVISNKNANVKRCQKVINAIFNYQKSKVYPLKNDGHENRNRSCFVLCNFLLNIMDEDVAFQELKLFNENFEQPLNEVRLKNIFNYCLENFTNEQKIEKNYRFFTNKRILEYLEISSGDFGIISTPNFKYNPCFQSLSQEERAKRKLEKKQEKEKVLQYLREGMSVDEIKNQTFFSISTIYNIARKNKITKSNLTKEKPWEKMGISRSSYYRKYRK